MKRVAIITGASSGMGKEFALKIDKCFNSIDEIWLIARRKDRLEELRREINKSCLIICEDITEYGFKDRFCKMLRQENPNIKILVNCAGYGIYGAVDYESIEVEKGMVDVNCTALTTITLATLPYMKKNSRIINLASSAGFLPQPNFSIYAATKSYVLSFSRSLNRELKKKGIYVTAVCPGPVATEFFTIAEKGIEKPAWKEMFMADAKDVVELAIKDSINKKELSIYGISMKLFLILTKLLPHKLILDVYSGK